MKFGRRRREDKLYKQWAKYDGLPREAIPRKENFKEVPASGGKRGGGLGMLYVLLVIGFLLLAAGLILLLNQGV